MDADGALTILDTAIGSELLKVAGHPALTALLPDSPYWTFALGSWSAASDRIAITATNEDTGDREAGILTLAGDIHVLPLNTENLSPDLRYAIRPHTIERGSGTLIGPGKASM